VGYWFSRDSAVLQEAAAEGFLVPIGDEIIAWLPEK